MQTSGWMTTRPPRTMCWVPCRRARRETLLPVSVSMKEDLGLDWAAAAAAVGGIVEGRLVRGFGILVNEDGGGEVKE